MHQSKKFLRREATPLTAASVVVFAPYAVQPIAVYPAYPTAATPLSAIFSSPSIILSAKSCLIADVTRSTVPNVVLMLGLPACNL